MSIRRNLLCVWVAALVVAGVGPLEAANPCYPTANWCDPWSCTTGSVNNPGTLTKTNELLCVGGSSGASVTAPTFNNGVRIRACHNDCGSSWNDGPHTVTYSPTNWWEPALPETFTTCEVFTYTAKVKGLSQDTNCPAPTAEATVGTLTVTVIQSEVNSIQFTSDHGVLRDNTTDWTDSGSLYSTPEWVKSPATNNPISHTKNTAVTLTVNVSVCPSGLTYDLKGDGGAAWFTFATNGVTATGAGQSFTLTAAAPLPDQVDILEQSINWTVKVNGETAPCTNASGAHKIYVTYGTPAGSVVTDIRVADVCEAAEGESTLDDCAAAIAEHLDDFQYDLNAPIFGPPGLQPPKPIWMLHEGSSYSSQCPGLADFINKHFQLLGMGSGVIKYCRAMATNGVYAALDQGTHIYRLCEPGYAGHLDPTTHDDINSFEYLMHLDSDGAPNHYEAACLFNGKYYATGVGVYSTPKEVVLGAFGTTSNINWFFATNNPPWNIRGCDTSPWTDP